MATCKICSGKVTVGMVVHSDCWEQVQATLAHVCDTLCKRLYECGSAKLLLIQLYCEDCPVKELRRRVEI